MSYAYDKITAIQHDNDVLRYEIALSKLKRTEASNNAEKMAEENYYLEKGLSKLREEVFKLKCENNALSSRRYRSRR
ncbi:jg9150 [Pararge aegeria aegeria]|uniref:Jg9150 protein n=1 Tax=Pararge aegeria aegeria TaxID=348720 RepID=A0A8S4QYG7_9NEOP|nr:jg9150 [Pararge aegeria aegeria]